MRKIIKKIEKEIHDYDAICITAPLLEKLLTNSKDTEPSATDITKWVESLRKLSTEGDTLDLSDYADLVAMVK